MELMETIKGGFIALMQSTVFLRSKTVLQCGERGSGKYNTGVKSPQLSRSAHAYCDLDLLWSLFSKPPLNKCNAQHCPKTSFVTTHEMIRHLS